MSHPLYIYYQKQALRHSNELQNQCFIIFPCIIQTLMENQNNLLKRIKSIDGNHSEMFSTQHTQSEKFFTTRNYIKNRDTRKSFTRLTQETSSSL